MISKKEETQIQNILKKEGVEFAYLFGSQAKGKANEFSDFDFAVFLNDKSKSKNYLELRLSFMAKLSKLLGHEVDVIVLNNKKLSSLLKFNIIKDGKVVYSQDEEARKYFVFEVLQEWHDQQYFESMWLKVYTNKVSK
ncbi:nucleotidyltransferase domain-containing protein [Patescibacteria group bacterium]|nr:nucleotidyltransferase domain-containing protein [Patescibacteria group bacterium]